MDAFGQRAESEAVQHTQTMRSHINKGSLRQDHPLSALPGSIGEVDALCTELQFAQHRISVSRPCLGASLHLCKEQEGMVAFMQHLHVGKKKLHKIESKTPFK